MIGFHERPLPGLLGLWRTAPPVIRGILTMGLPRKSGGHRLKQKLFNGTRNPV